MMMIGVRDVGLEESGWAGQEGEVQEFVDPLTIDLSAFRPVSQGANVDSGIWGWERERETDRRAQEK